MEGIFTKNFVENSISYVLNERKFLVEFDLLGVDRFALNAYLSFRTEQTSKENWNLKLKWTYQYFWVEDLDHTA